ncbi:MAG TPA: MnhB domain-containing protein [Egibacteraceae bacterium]|nr:MnhB domain-containing protein [Egibacteraceae bacterium]
MTSLILHTGTRAVFHTIMLLSVYLLFAGHNAPGGGFIGGLIGGAAMVLLYLAAGADGLRRVVRVEPVRILGAGVLFAVLTGVVAVLFGEAFLSSGLLELSVPLIGEVYISSVLAFDVGVYLVVVGLVLQVLSALGPEGGRVS